MRIFCDFGGGKKNPFFRDKIAKKYWLSKKNMIQSICIFVGNLIRRHEFFI